MKPAAPAQCCALAAAALLALLAACSTAPPAPGAVRAPVRYEPEAFDAPPVVDADAWLAAWPAWRSACAALEARADPAAAPWHAVCSAAGAWVPRDGGEAQAFFAARMDRYRVRDGNADAARMTGYYEPVFAGSATRAGAFAFAVYAAPSPAATQPRAELDRSGRLQGLELAWLRDPLEAYLLEVQGSGRIRLPDGSLLRLAYAGSNGQPYRSIARILIDRGALPSGATLPALRAWARAHPQELPELISQNPRRVFFRAAIAREPLAGPTGALGAALTPGVSVAVDPRYLPLGAPLLLTTRLPGAPAAHTRVAIAQDTGAAIQGPLRIDWFWGTGEAAEAIAGEQNGEGEVRLLLPRGTPPP